MSWQPIETAPKDRRIIVWTGQNQYIAQWNDCQINVDNYWAVADFNGDEIMGVKATHWHEAPDNPKAENE